MDISTLRRIGFGLVAVIVLACAIVVGVSEHTKAQDASRRADSTQASLTLAEGNLEEATATNDANQQILSTTRQRLTVTSRSLDRTKTQRNTLSHQLRACRYLVKVNDHLLYGMTAEQAANGHLIDHNPQAARRSLLTAAAHTRAIIALVKRAGYRNISALVDACAPPRR